MPQGTRASFPGLDCEGNSLTVGLSCNRFSCFL